MSISRAKGLNYTVWNRCSTVFGHSVSTLPDRESEIVFSKLEPLAQCSTPNGFCPCRSVWWLQNGGSLRLLTCCCWPRKGWLYARYCVRRILCANSYVTVPEVSVECANLYSHRSQKCLQPALPAVHDPWCPERGPPSCVMRTPATFLSYIQ